MNQVQKITTKTIQGWMDESPFIKFLGITVESMDAESYEVVMKMPIHKKLERGNEISGQFHGGPIASFIDTAGDFAVAIKVNGGVPTINFRVDYLRPSSGTYLLATARARKIGRTIGVVDIDVHDDQGRLTAVGRATYSSMVG